MQIYNTPQIPNTTVPNFKAIKSVKCEGLYKKFPEYGKELVDTFKNNNTAMNFCKKYDVDIVFYACEKAMSAVESSIHLMFKNPTKKKFLGIFGSKKDRISLSNYQNKYDSKKSLKESTNGLKKYITEGSQDSNTGLLDSHIKMKEKTIDEILNKRDQIKVAKQHNSEQRVDAKNNLKYNKMALKDSISNLMNESSMK